jgi:coniferyl-aldehyde dehydrogenase
MTATTEVVSARPAKSPPTATPDLQATLARLRDAHRRAGVPDEGQRLRWLSKLERTLLANKARIADTLCEDYGNRSRHETLVAELFITLSAIRYAKENLRDWMLAERREVAMTFFPARAEVIFQPLGVVGIIAPWNYPIQLALAPLVSALAAGNRVMIKPSEIVPRTAELLVQIVSETFTPDEVVVVTGGPDVGEAFSKLAFDHLVFTGSTRLGRIVMKAAAENLVPCTLELGGKSPAIVSGDFAIDQAASRIMAGKCFNAGQTCIAPDYALLPRGREESFIAAAKAAVAKMYPTLAANPDYTSVVNAHHYKRLVSYLDDARAKGATIVELNPAGETLDPAQHKLAPTLVLGTTDDMKIMQEEIFGPLLPLRSYGELGEALDYVNDHDRPLALYFFSHDDRLVDRVLRETTSGGVCINETMLQVAVDDLPFGGVGPSGMGHYHAREGFETMSKKKPVFYQARMNSTSLLRAPYGKTIDSLLKVLIGA